MVQSSNRILEPACRGEQVLSGPHSGRILPSLSQPPAFLRSLAAGTLALVLAYAGARGADVRSSGDTGPLVPLLAPLVQELRSVCGCDTFRVEWRVPPGLVKRAAALESLAAVLDPGPTGSNGLEKCPDRVSVRLIGLDHGRRVELLMGGQTLCFSTVPVLRHRVPSGEVLQEGDLALSHGWFPPSAVRLGERTVVGAYNTTALSTGAWIGRSILRDAPLVRRNEVLRVVYEDGGIRLEGRGQTHRDGWAGDHVAVRLEGAKRDCEAVVSGPREVQVGGAGGSR
jgi:flagella basal body P-ring formation protein FlgA